MADTEYKRITTPTAPLRPDARALSWPALLQRDPWRIGLQAADSVVTGARILLASHGGGSLEWEVGNFTSGGLSQVFPDPLSWRIQIQSHAELAPGQCLELRALALPSGGTETFVVALGVWKQYGPSAAVRMLADFDNGTTTSSVVVERSLASSPLVDGAEPTDDGAGWESIEHVFAGGIRPNDPTPASEAAWLDGFPRVELTLAVRGGARIIAANVAERTDVHTTRHDGASTLHGLAGQLPHKIPQTKAIDGGTFGEPRFGTARGSEAAAAQNVKLGPMIMIFGSRSEAGSEVTDLEPDPLSITATSFRSPWDTGVTSWNEGALGWAISGAYSRPSPTNLRSRLRGTATVLPVRVRALARFTTNLGSKIGSIKFASSARSAVVLSVPESSSWAWYTTTGLLEACTTSRDTYALLQVLARVSSGTMEIRALCAGQGAYPIAAV